MIWAIYRIHYGTDFITESIKSIINDVDKVFIFYSEKPWVITDYINYKKKNIPFPKNPEDVNSFLKKNIISDKIIIDKYECSTPKNQFGELFKIACNKLNKKPKQVLFLEPDMIIGKNQLKLFKFELKMKFWLDCIIARQIEIWKYNKFDKTNISFRIPLRKNRVGPVLWKIKKNSNIETNFGGEPLKKKKKFSNFVYILNLGFSFNKDTMFYKHLMALAFSKKIGDSVPDENWYEDKWLNWNQDVENLEISKGSQHLIKRAFKYKIPYKYFQFLI